MRKEYLKPLFVVIMIVFLSACATQTQQPLLKAQDLNPMMGTYTQKADNFLIILDASGSMRDTYDGRVKLELAKDTLCLMSQTIPGLKLDGGLRVFGGKLCPFTKRTDLVYGLESFAGSKFEGALKDIKKASGPSPMDLAITAAIDDLDACKGNIAVIIIGDADNMDDSPVKAAYNLKTRFGDRVCIYSILVGDDPGGKSLMEKLVNAGACGFLVNADSLATSQDMANFVKKVFFEIPGGPDADNDGVADSIDKCPKTPAGAIVNHLGCWVLEGICFDTDKAIVNKAAYPVLDQVVIVLKQNPNLEIVIEGHTDSTGPEVLNQPLSEKRAEAVKQYFVEKGVDAKALSAVGLGEASPIAPNKTAKGRAENRRVELVPVR